MMDWQVLLSLALSSPEGGEGEGNCTSATPQGGRLESGAPRGDYGTWVAR